MGVSLDNIPDHPILTVFEILFTIFCGPDIAWNLFDGFCIMTAFFDFYLSYIQDMFFGESSGTRSVEGVQLIKMLRLARLARLVRLLRYKAFHELRMMVYGVVSGMRVLAWAIVLLGMCIFILGCCMRMVVGEKRKEFATLFSAMLTLFRCFTDGCSAYDGTPLQGHLFYEYGVIWMIAYFFVFLFVTIGIFNLIMAIFIERVLASAIQRKQEELGSRSELMSLRCKEVIGRQFTDANEYVDDIDYDDLEDKIVTKDQFTLWLEKQEILDLLEEIEVDQSSKFELFDALDIDGGGELTFDEVVSGLMMVRGPITKVDVVATRLKMKYLRKLLETLCIHLGVDI